MELGVYIPELKSRKEWRYCILASRLVYRSFLSTCCKRRREDISRGARKSIEQQEDYSGQRNRQQRNVLQLLKG